MSNLIELLSDVAKDPDKLLKLRKNPEPVMEYYGLSSEEKEVLMCGEQKKLSEYIKNQVDGILPADAVSPNG